MPDQQWSKVLDDMPTLRDHYAMAALTGLLANSGLDIAKIMASDASLLPKSAFEVADIMLQYRPTNNEPANS